MKKDNYARMLFKSAIFVIIFIMVIFRILLFYIAPGEYIPAGNNTTENDSSDRYKTISRQKNSAFMDECKTLCSAYEASEEAGDAVKYCEYKRVLDWDNDNMTDFFLSQATGDLSLKACDESVFCFIVYGCPMIDWEECKNVLCEYHSEDSSIVSSILDPGSCGAEWPDELSPGRQEICKDSGCVPSEENEESCSDGIDNDCDNLVDGNDSDCETAVCIPSEDVEVSCADGIDNDCDDLMDDEDSDCEEEILYPCPDKCLPVPGALCCCNKPCETASDYGCSSRPEGSC